MIHWIAILFDKHFDFHFNLGTNRQSPVKNQPINHKVDNFYVLTKVPNNTRET